MQIKSYFETNWNAWAKSWYNTLFYSKRWWKFTLCWFCTKFCVLKRFSSGGIQWLFKWDFNLLLAVRSGNLRGWPSPLTSGMLWYKWYHCHGGRGERQGISLLRSSVWPPLSVGQTSSVHRQHSWDMDPMSTHYVRFSRFLRFLASFSQTGSRETSKFFLQIWDMLYKSRDKYIHFCYYVYTLFTITIF